MCLQVIITLVAGEGESPGKSGAGSMAGIRAWKEIGERLDGVVSHVEETIVFISRPYSVYTPKINAIYFSTGCDGPNRQWPMR